MKGIFVCLNLWIERFLYLKYYRCLKIYNKSYRLEHNAYISSQNPFRDENTKIRRHATKRANTIVHKHIHKKCTLPSIVDVS